MKVYVVGTGGDVTEQSIRRTWDEWNLAVRDLVENFGVRREDIVKHNGGSECYWEAPHGQEYPELNKVFITQQQVCSSS